MAGETIVARESRVNPFNGLKREELEMRRERYMRMMHASSISERRYFMEVIDNIDEQLKRKR